MLILALFLVLFSNYMEERLEAGKSVLLVTCQLTTPSGTSVDEEREALISGETVMD